MIISLVFFFSPKAFVGDTDTARNYLSTIVSCLSTIFALCISIALVAIQLTASRYTHRVLDMFLKMPFNASLILFYFVTIIQSLFLLSRITEPIHMTLPSMLQPQMNADMILVVFCFVILIVYMYAVMKLLKPEQIIDNIQLEFRAAVHKRKTAEALIRVEQVCDIAKRAAVEMDSTTGTATVRTLMLMASMGDPQMRQSVARQFVEIGSIAAKERESGMLISVLHALQEMGTRHQDEGWFEDAPRVVEALRQLTRSSLIGQDQLPYVEEVVENLFRISTTALTNACEKGEACADLLSEVVTAMKAIGLDVLARDRAGLSYVMEDLIPVKLFQLRTLSVSAGLFVYAERVRRNALLAQLAMVNVALLDAPRSAFTALLCALCDVEAARDITERSELILFCAALARYMKREDVVKLCLSRLPACNVRESDWTGAERVALSRLFDFEDPFFFIESVCKSIHPCSPLTVSAPH